MWMSMNTGKNPPDDSTELKRGFKCLVVRKKDIYGWNKWVETEEDLWFSGTQRYADKSEIIQNVS